MPDHLDRALGLMDDAAVDVLLLGREANARWVTGANRLWLAGTRPFAPGCVVVRSPRSVHMLSITDDGLPPLVPPDHLYPITWNPLNMLGAVAAVPGVAEARRVGVDGLSPLFEQLIGAVLPGKELVDAEALLRDARRVKTPEDVEAIRAAAAVARDTVDAVLDGFAAGHTPDALRGLFFEAMCAHGVTTPAFEPDIRVDGARVTVRAGVLRDGWEACIARTAPDGREPGAAVSADGCRAGASVGALRAAGTVVEGVGVGHEDLADDDVLTPGMVVYAETTEDGATRGDTLLITEDSPEAL